MLVVAARPIRYRTDSRDFALIRAGLSPGREVIGMAKFKIGRSAEDGRFVPVKKAQQQASTHVVETIKTDPKKDK